MAGSKLKLSGLKNATEYPLDNSVPRERCLIHVKLTDFSVKMIENLIHSDKGAFFSLWFEENGGKMAIPVDSGAARKVQFKTAPLQGGEGQSSLECVHQEIDQHKKHQLTCWGPIKHRLTVQGTEESYESTKTKMKRAEELRKEQRAQEIKLPRLSKSKKLTQQVERSSPSPVPVRKVNRPKPPVSGSKPTMSGSNVKAAVPVASKGPASGRSSHSLKDRVIHLLALKPQKRTSVVIRLKRETKRSETTMTNLDAILNEVAELNQGSYKLKPQFYSSLQVDDWPFISDAERQLLKRTMFNSEGVAPPTSDQAPPTVKNPSMPGPIAPSKRSLSSTDKVDLPTKKQRFSHPPSSQSTPPQPSHPLSSTYKQNTSASIVKPTPQPFYSSATTQPLYSSFVSASSEATSSDQLQSVHSTSSGPSLAHNTEPLEETTIPEADTFGAKESDGNMSVSETTDMLRLKNSGSQSRDNSDSQNSGSQNNGSQNSGLPSSDTDSRSLDYSNTAHSNITHSDVVHSNVTHTKKKKEKKKKNKKHKVKEESTSDPSSTSSIPDYMSQFPVLTSDGQRAEYKHLFNDEYVEYLDLKNHIELATTQHKRECSALSDRLKTVTKHSQEYKDVMREICDKYAELQKNKQYQEDRQRFEELHHKLDHIKRMVIQYDSNRT